MATTLVTGFNDVPNEILPVSPGVKRFQITRVKMDDSATGEQQVSITLKCITDCPDLGREIYDNPKLSHPRDKVRLKRLALSAKQTFGNDGSLDLMCLVDACVTVVVVHNNVVNKMTGQAKVYSNVQDYLLPGEAGYIS